MNILLHTAISVSWFTLKPAWNAHWCIYTGCVKLQCVVGGKRNNKWSLANKIITGGSIQDWRQLFRQVWPWWWVSMHKGLGGAPQGKIRCFEIASEAILEPKCFISVLPVVTTASEPTATEPSCLEGQSHRSTFSKLWTQKWDVSWLKGCGLAFKGCRDAALDFAHISPTPNLSAAWSHAQMLCFWSDIYRCPKLLQEWKLFSYITTPALYYLVKFWPHPHAYWWNMASLPIHVGK